MEEKEELNAESYIPKKEKPRLKMSRYTVMLIPDSADGSKTIELTIDRIARYVVLVLAAVIIITSLIVSFAVKNYRLRNDSSLKSRIENLEMEKSGLEAKIQELSDLLADSDVQIQALKENTSALELEVAAEYIPSIIPYKGSAVMLSNTITPGALSFACLENTYVVATAKGVVESIEDNYLGTNITVDHGNGYKTCFITTGDVKVKVGDELLKRDEIAKITNDDETFGYMVLLNDQFEDPKKFFDK